MSLSQHMFWRTLLLLVTVSLAAATDCSSSRFNFFPEGRLNIPGGWNKANQTRAGNDCNGHLLPIAVQGIPKPLLHFLPVHSLLEAGAEVVAEHVPDSKELAAIIQAAVAKQQLQQHEELKAQLLQQQQQQQQATVAEQLLEGTLKQPLRKLQQEDSSTSKSQATSVRRTAWMKLQDLLRLPKLPTMQLFGRKPEPASKRSSSRMRQAKATHATSKQQVAGSSDATPAVREQPTAVPPAGMSHSPAASKQQSAIAAVEEEWKVSVPAEYEFTVNVNEQLWFTSKTFKGGSSIPEVNFNANVTEGRRDVFDATIFREGINTVQINVTVLKGTAVISNGMHSAPSPRRAESFASPPIDFFFFMNGNETHDSRPKANVTVNSCQPEISLEFSDSKPQPVLLDGYRLTYSPTSTSQAFFLPVYYTYGSFLEGLDGSTDLQSDNTEGNVKNFGVYVTRLPSSPSNFNMSVPQMSWLREGWYSFTVEGAIWSPNSQYDNLMSVAGIDKFGSKHAEYLTVMPGGDVTDTISLYGGLKGAGWVLPQFNKTRVGVQRRPTWINYFQGPEAAVTLGSRAAFSWEFSGLGNATCIINGVNPSNATGTCTSPLVYPIVTTLNQTLVVNYTDVCAVTHSIGMTFGTFGWELQGSTAMNALGGNQALALSDRGELAARRSSSSAAAAVNRAAWMHLAAAAAALVFGLLLL
ncbi:hypothetical protein COO60DRAFT_411981 [Scenedesmus sp. NREL 46B-D3]|nr:hypothetical protein COO60DRAFT_411981 [Scenedesmus sp. NREL 46B-D3]